MATADSPMDLQHLLDRLDGYDPDALPVASAQHIIRDFIVPVQTVERVAIRDALSRVLAEPLLSTLDVPAHDNAAMDGYAVRGDDVKGASATLQIIGTALAGRPLDLALQPGQAVRIMTGAVMPTGADTVVPQEIVTADEVQVRIPASQVPGQHRRHRGEDLALGRAALSAGRRITPADLGLAASLGVAELPVRRRIRVAFFSSGDELRSIGEPLGPGQVYDSNRYTLHGMLRRLDCELLDLGVVPDRPEALRAVVSDAANHADAIISSGGVSVGAADYTKQIMQTLGDVRFWTVAMRPGRPVAFGRVGNAYYFGLPGNPVAVMITFYFFARQALQQLMGQTLEPLPMLRAAASAAIRKRPGRTEYQRGIFDVAPGGQARVTLTGSQGSGVLRSMSEANCIVVLHHDQGPVEAGDPVDCLPFHGLV